MEKTIIYQGGNMFCALWAIGWLFTIGYLRLSFWRGVLGLIVWPYFMGKNFSKTPEAK